MLTRTREEVTGLVGTESQRRYTREWYTLRFWGLDGRGPKSYMVYGDSMYRYVGGGSGW